MNPKIQSLIAKILLQSPVAPSRINFFQSCFQQSNQSQISSAGKHEFKMQQIYYTKINVLVLHDCCSKQRQKPSTQMNKKLTYVLLRLKKCWRSTKARVERNMMVVHMVPRVHRHPAFTEKAGSKYSTHSVNLKHS